MALLLDAMLEKLSADGDAKDADWRDAWWWWFGRRGGGGAGAWMLTRRLEDRDLVESMDPRRASSGSSATLGAAMAVAAAAAAFGATDALLSPLA